MKNGLALLGIALIMALSLLTFAYADQTPRREIYRRASPGKRTKRPVRCGYRHPKRPEQEASEIRRILDGRG
jgi:hypothetical protein